MKYLIIISLISTLTFEYHKVAMSNELKQKAEFSFKNRQFSHAIGYYEALMHTYKVKDENLYLNLAHAHFNISNYKSASQYYKLVAFSKNPKTVSLINHQLGVIAAYEKKEKLALTFFKNALKAYSKNEQARYNYELISKKLESEKNINEAKNNKTTKTSKNQQNKGNGDQKSTVSLPSENEGEAMENSLQEEVEKTTKPSGIDNNNQKNSKDLQMNIKGAEEATALETIKFNEIHLTEAQAKQILESMKEQEFMLIQESIKKFDKTIKKNNHDW